MFAGHVAVLVNRGLEKEPVEIKDIQVGDLVLTHRNRYRPVTELRTQQFTGDMIRISIDPNRELPTVLSTTHQLFWVSRKTERYWLPAVDIQLHYDEPLMILDGFVPPGQGPVSPYLLYAREKIRQIDITIYRLEVAEDNSYVANRYIVHA